MSVTCVLSIGTTHPHNVAGVGRDLIVGAELGVRVLTAVAAVSAQDERGVRALHVLPAKLVREQLASFVKAEIDAVRVGVLGSVENVAVVAQLVASLAPAAAVVDPVFAASAGGALADDATIAELRGSLAAMPTVILTPNLQEAARLLGRERIGRTSLEEAARSLYALGAQAVLLKGGDLAGDPVDVLASAQGIERFTAPRIAGRMPGTGCTLAMALACELARRRALRDAVAAARQFVRAKMTAAAGANRT